MLILIYSVHCTLYSVQCTVYKAALYTVLYTYYIVYIEQGCTRSSYYAKLAVSTLNSYVQLQLDEKQPLEYLSEMRLVTVVFINLQLHEVSKYELSRILQESFKIIYMQVKPRQGQASHYIYIYIYIYINAISVILCLI